MLGGELPLKNDEIIESTDIESVNTDQVDTDSKSDTSLIEGITEQDSVAWEIDENDSVPTDAEDSESESDEVEYVSDDGVEPSDDEDKNTKQSEVDEPADTPDVTHTLAEDKKPATVQKERRVDSIFDFLELFVFTLAAVFIITSFFFRYSIVDGGSMESTLHEDERLLLTNFLYTPKCGDVVVVHDMSSSIKVPIVKRIIATEGQTVKVTKTAIYVDGEKLDEPYVYTNTSIHEQVGGGKYDYKVIPSEPLLSIVIDQKNDGGDDDYYVVKVPKGQIFVMGDHRNVSNDSRGIGTIHEDAIIGKVVLRFYPFDKFGKIE